MQNKKLIGLRMKELRKRRGLSQEKLAEMAETSPNYLSRMERGTENPTLDMLIKIADALNLELWELFDYKHKATVRELREMLKQCANELQEEEKLATAVRVLKAISR